MSDHDSGKYTRKFRFVRRRLIRSGLRHLGPERVRNAIPTVGANSGVKYGSCFLSMAYPEWLQVKGAICRIAETRSDLMALSMAHWVADPILMEELMIYLAEHGITPEPVPAETRSKP